MKRKELCTGRFSFYSTVYVSDCLRKPNFGYRRIEIEASNVLYLLLPISVDGGWGGWSDWSDCSTACGPGERVRKRLCNKPEPRNGGKKCAGASEQVGDCTAQPCPGNAMTFTGQFVV